MKASPVAAMASSASLGPMAAESLLQVSFQVEVRPWAAHEVACSAARLLPPTLALQAEPANRRRGWAHATGCHPAWAAQKALSEPNPKSEDSWREHGPPSLPTAAVTEGHPLPRSSWARAAKVPFCQTVQVSLPWSVYLPSQAPSIFQARSLSAAMAGSTRSICSAAMAASATVMRMKHPPWAAAAASPVVHSWEQSMFARRPVSIRRQHPEAWLAAGGRSMAAFPARASRPKGHAYRCHPSQSLAEDYAAERTGSHPLIPRQRGRCLREQYPDHTAREPSWRRGRHIDGVSCIPGTQPGPRNQRPPPSQFWYRVSWDAS